MPQLTSITVGGPAISFNSPRVQMTGDNWIDTESIHESMRKTKEKQTITVCCPDAIYRLQTCIHIVTDGQRDGSVSCTAPREPAARQGAETIGDARSFANHPLGNVDWHSLMSASVLNEEDWVWVLPGRPVARIGWSQYP
ncbi:hypothetical protein HRR83_006568 [Exophiala dermatitidis]|uniref:Uncharacterized protein n=1 Tax=Exophiala dermatitidis TaxID=5970 RepID=A0AAN6ERR2_EXODE|nr:hypothetical protein HRR74_005728 [Exophiala dermatitidis]KAJ4515447.1 hypothetical protein HRR73_005279 [Exophiala dermatitidis]KAJ4536496.1 hypothetical protein HRR77_007412 [Exophiala dermatitidis]KAJ4540976.1 hypothetical protein HRR76_004358 [Exophiala dermatitidis]KAJ4554801.1 hypothetical protein HRR79_009376 [Exophiala dermatitidis]